ncbi:MAG: CSLREA domain-containing protein, partial [bacterium]|nr:CSLREA domain-containing protein [bacterium]
MRSALIALLLLGSMAVALDAATFTVTKETDDNGPCAVDDCTLREAIIASNNNPGFDTILIPGGTYVLSIPGWEDFFSLTGDLDIWDDIEIIGDTQLPVVIDAAGIDRVLEIVGVTAEISNVTITGGS